MPSERDNISWEIVEHLGVISTGNNGWSTELNLVAWNGNKPKYDVRGWDQDHEHMGRGVTLHEREFRKMIDLFFKHNSRKVVGKAKAEQAEREERSRQYSPYGYSGNRNNRWNDAEEPETPEEAAGAAASDSQWDPPHAEVPEGSEEPDDPGDPEDDLDPELLLKDVPDSDPDDRENERTEPVDPPGEAFTALTDETPF